VTTARLTNRNAKVEPVSETAVVVNLALNDVSSNSPT